MSNPLKAVVTADITSFQSSMTKAGMSAKSAAGVISTALIGATAVTVALGKASIGAAKSYETLRIRLQLLAGDMKKGAKEFEILKKFAEESAFATEEVIGGYIRLRAVAGQQFATENIENIAFASKVAGESLETMSARVGELILRVNTGLTGGLLAKSIRTFGTALGEEAVLELVKMAQAGENSAVVIDRIRKALSRLGQDAKKEFGTSAEGLEKQLGGVLTGGLASLGEGPMEAYKEVLRSLIDLSGEFGDESKDLAGALTEVFKSMAEITKDEGFKSFLKDLMALTSTAVKLVNILSKPIKALSAGREVISRGNRASRQGQLAELLSNLDKQGVPSKDLIAIRERFGGAYGEGGFKSIAQANEFRSLLETSRRGHISLGKVGAAPVYIVDNDTGEKYDIHNQNKFNKDATE